MPSSTSISSFSATPSPAAGGTAPLPATETLFRTRPWIVQAYQAALAFTHDRLSSQPVDDTSATVRQSVEDARIRARTAWSRAATQNNFASLTNRPNISRGLSTPPMPLILTEYTTTLTSLEYYMFLERCWIFLERKSTGATREGINPSSAAAGDIPSPITAYSFDLLDLGNSPPQIHVTPANESTSVDGEIPATDEIPVDHSTLNQLVELIDELLAEDGTTNIADRIMNATLLQNYAAELEDSDKASQSIFEDSDKENQSVLGDSDKENSAPLRFLTNYAPDEQNGDFQGSSELEDSDKENVRPLSPLLPFATVYLFNDDAGPSFNGSDQENQSPLGEASDDDSDKENQEPHHLGILSTLFYDPSAEFAGDYTDDASPEAFDENESELEDSDKENIPVLFTPSATQNHQGPSDNALMLTFGDDESDGAVSGSENGMLSRDEEVPAVIIFDHDRGYDTDVSDFSEGELDDYQSADSDSEHSSTGRCHSRVNADVCVLDDSRSELDDAAHDAHSTDAQSANERCLSHQEWSDNTADRDCGESGSSGHYDYRWTEEQVTLSDIAAGRAVLIGGLGGLADCDNLRHYKMLRPMARLPRRFTIRRTQPQSVHRVEGDTSRPGRKDELAGDYSIEPTSRSASSEGEELEQCSPDIGAQADASHQNKTSENHECTGERRLGFPTSYERTRMRV